MDTRVNNLEPKAIGLKEKFRERIKAIPPNWIKLLPVILILLALPVTVILVKSQTNSSTRAAQTPGEGTTSKPNIILIVLDDIPYVGDSFFQRLPNINDIFLRHGLSFQNADGEDPLCCPGRANILTGQYSHINKVVRNDARLLDPRETIATELQAQGYYTFISGKYLNLTERLNNKKPPGWNNAAIMSGSYFNYSAFINGQEEHHGTTTADYSTDVFAKRALEFLHAAPADKPVFGFITPYAVHFGRNEQGVRNGFQPVAAPRYRGDPRCASLPTYMPANFNEGNVADKPAWVRGLRNLGSAYPNGFPIRNHCEALLSVDDEIGRIANELKAQGRFDNTLWILIGDNGMGWGAHRWISKMAPYATSIPLYMSWPFGITNVRGQVTTRVENVDLASTLCELTGCVMGPYPNGHGTQGQSFVGLFAPAVSNSVPNRTAILMEHVATSVIPKWRSVKTTSQSPLGLWHYVRYSTGEKELYDVSRGPCLLWNAGMSGDPCELTNLAGKAKYASIQKQLDSQVNSMWGLSPSAIDPSEATVSSQELQEIQADEDD